MPMVNALISGRKTIDYRSVKSIILWCDQRVHNKMLLIKLNL